MTGPPLTFSAETADAFVSQLSCMNIRVPPIGAGRTSQHREKYVMARFLATAYMQGIIEVPISIEHRDNTGNPDFCLSFGETKIGAECVEVVSQEGYAIKAIRQSKFPGTLSMLHRLEPKDHIYSNSRRENIASGSVLGSVWVGDAPEREWAPEQRAYALLPKGKCPNTYCHYVMPMSEKSCSKCDAIFGGTGWNLIPIEEF